LLGRNYDETFEFTMMKHLNSQVITMLNDSHMTIPMTVIIIRVTVITIQMTILYLGLVQWQGKWW